MKDFEMLIERLVVAGLNPDIFAWVASQVHAAADPMDRLKM